MKDVSEKKIFHKVHLQLTCLFTAIIISILCLSAGIYLRLAQNSLKENHLLSFQRSMDALRTNFEQQSVITFQYLRKLESSGDFLLFLWDRGTPYNFNGIEHHAPWQELAQSILQQYGEESEAFVYQAADRTQFDVCIAHIQMGQLSAAQSLTAWDGQEGLTVLVLSPRAAFLRQLSLQRTNFMLLAAASSILLSLFAWFFTGRLLRPIQENHKRQVQFVSDASHELRTPLTVIRSCITVQPPRFRETIQEECLHMSRLVDELLTLNNLQNKPLSLELLEPDTILLNLYERAEVLAKEKGLRLRIELPEETLPRFQGDRGKIEQLLMILIQNAISYTPSGGRILLRVLNRKKEIAFQVADTGTGIPDEEKDRIFERFYRSDSSRSDKDHFGLGLCIARELVLAHRGRITVSDSPEGGAVFTCLFPITHFPVDLSAKL